MSDSDKDLPVDKMIDMIRQLLNDFQYSHDLYETRVLCRCIFSSILCLIEGAYTLLRDKNMVAYSVLVRSIAEYVIDFRYIAIYDSKETNRKFIDYYKFVRFWRKDKIVTLKDQIPRIISEYDDYLRQASVDDIKSCMPKQTFITIGEINDFIRRKYRKSWTGLTFPDRLQKVLLSYSKSEGDNINLIIDGYYAFDSQFTHPTPYSGIPHFNLKTLEFSIDYEKSLFETEKAQEFLVIALFLALRTLKQVHTASEQKAFLQLIKRLFDSFPALHEIFVLKTSTSDSS